MEAEDLQLYLECSVVILKNAIKCMLILESAWNKPKGRSEEEANGEVSVINQHTHYIKLSK